jgi:gliding-associated putative ABC transporter substrate-binding component GldG
LEELLFKYGARINPSLVQDLNSGTYPVVTGNFGDQPQISFLPWPYFPVIINYSDHPVVKNMDATLMRFCSYLDTVKAPGVRKSILMKTTEYSRTRQSPTMISFEDFMDPPPPEAFSSGELPVAVLLEGFFTSKFKNRLLPLAVDKDLFRDSGSGKVFICSDGDFIRNEINVQNGKPLELGVEQFSKTRYANADLVINLMNYLTGDEDIIQIRQKEIALRPLDKVRIEKERSYWQAFNIALPVVLIVIFGLVKFWLRKKKYA